MLPKKVLYTYITFHFVSGKSLPIKQVADTADTPTRQETEALIEEFLKMSKVWLSDIYGTSYGIKMDNVVYMEVKTAWEDEGGR